MMLVTCHPERIAYVPPGFDATEISRAGYQIIDDPDATTAHPVEAGCGATFEIPDDLDTWDITTDRDGTIIERHLAPRCPYCGAIADHLSMLTQPELGAVRELEAPKPEPQP